MQALDPGIAEEMRKEADEIQERQNSTTFTKQWMLGGKKDAIVAPGASVTARLLPRWDFAQSIIAGPPGADGKPTRIANPNYKPGKSYVKALEHAWQNSEGKWVFAYCPKTLIPEAHCAVCKAAGSLIVSGDKAQKDLGYNMKARRVYIYNAIIDNPRRLGPDGLVDIRILKASDTIHRAILVIMTGGQKPEFARGDITHPVNGYDLMLSRPLLGTGGRWTVTYAPDATKLYDATTQGAAFKNWPLRMIDLDKMLKDEVKDSVAIFKLYRGRDPKPGELDDAPVAAAVVASGDVMGDDFVAAAASAAAPAPAVVQANAVLDQSEAPDDEFMPTTAPAQRAARR